MFVVGLPIIVKQPVSTRVNVTDDVIFDCTASAYGDIKITWKKLNSTLPNTALPLEEIKSVNKKTSILKISNAIGYYKGYYYATISNGGGEINTSTVYLDVISKYLSSCFLLYNQVFYVPSSLPRNDQPTNSNYCKIWRNCHFSLFGL